MRLLRVDENVEFSLTDDLIDNIPPYAILSHTWGEDHEEIGFKDMSIGPKKTKLGYNKLRFCAQQTARDGLRYFWVDTCCIDKANSVELQEAINSMFRWYRNAEKCYVYLADISTNGYDQSSPSSQPWEPAFRQCRWFTRGWTLQELLAPSSVEFFCSKGKRLGDKKLLERQIHEITGIPIGALQGTPLSEFSVDERMSWAENRQTKREEDKAYSLLGIFDVYMPFIYGESTGNALRRLRKEIYGDYPLERLPYAAEAPFNSYTKQHESTCLPDTRVDLRRVIYNWADRQDERTIFWLNGLAGTGKSTIARTVARHYFDKQRLGASFFFSRGGGDVGHAGKFVTSIAVQLATSIPTLHQYVSGAVTEHSDIASRSLRDQWNELVLRPLSRLDGTGRQTLYILVVDALDECSDEDDIRIILHLLAEIRSLGKVRLRVFLTSRPETPIRHRFCQIPDREHQDFMLHNTSPSIVDNDIAIFLEYNLKVIRQERSLDASWPGEEIVRQLVQNACGLFIWAATTCRFIREGKRFAARRLDTILKGSGGAVTEPEKHLDEIYTTVLSHSVSSEYTEEEKKESYRMLRQILGSIVILFSPLSAHSLYKLLPVTKEDIDQTLEDLHSVVDIPKDYNQLFRLHHPSFRDFLLSNGRCKDPNFWVDEKQAHRMLAKSCIRLMSTFLKQDVCEVNAPGTLATQIEGSRVEQRLPNEVRYACLYWIQHLQKGCTQLRDNDQVHQFLQQHLLHWLEALGWIGKVSEGNHAITLLESFAPSIACPSLSAFVHDAKRFILYNWSAIELAPLQTYCSALVFAPTASIIRKQFKEYIPRWVQRSPKVESNRNALLQTLEGHSSPVNAVAFSPDGKKLASASSDRTVKLWDAGLGTVLQTLEGHLSYISGVAFSPDGKTLASASHDSTVKLWDAGSSAVLQTLKGHSSYTAGVAFSPDGRTLASASWDYTVKVWDVRSGAALQTLEGHSEWVCSVAFSPDGKTLASASYDRMVILWDAGHRELRQTLKGHSASVNAVVFSPDGKTLASASDDSTVKLWDVKSGVLLETLKGHSSYVVAVAFSPNGKVLASASHGTVKLWEASLRKQMQTLRARSAGRLLAVAFSPKGQLLASASGCGAVDLWDTGLVSGRYTLGGHSSVINSVVFSPDGKLLASASGDKTVKLWEVSSGTALKTFKNHSSYVFCVAFSPDGKTLASASDDSTVKLWDAGSGAVLQTLTVDSIIHSLSFSDHGTFLQTDRGPLYSTRLSSNAAPSRPSLPPSIFVSKHWVSRNGERLLWLPSEYRPIRVAVQDGIVVFGCVSGRVLIMEFAF